MLPTTANLDAIKAGGWPYWATDDGSIVLVNADCLDVLPTLSGIDCVVTDPPYGISYQNKRGDIRPHVDFADMIAGDADTKVGQRLVDHCIGRDFPTCVFAHNRDPWAGDWRQFLVWDKGGAVGGGGDLATCWKFTWELIQVRGFGRLNGYRDEAVLRFQIGQNAMPHHPTQKPLPLMLYLLEKLTDVGEIVSDPFMGSGTTGVACVRLGRQFIGIEKEPKYFRIAIDRIKKELGRMRLFEKPARITQKELAI
jgi:predicted RNA methylase